ncbi:MAG: potassium channel family protein [Bacteroidota bacterium]
MFNYLLHIGTFFKLENFGGLTLMVSSFIIVGTVVYRYGEGWSWLDSYYFSVMTLSTVGYGDFNPTTPFTKIFTTVYVLAGLGVILNFVSAFQEHRYAAIHKTAEDMDEANKDVGEELFKEKSKNQEQ